MCFLLGLSFCIFIYKFQNNGIIYEISFMKSVLFFFFFNSLFKITVSSKRQFLIVIRITKLLLLCYRSEAKK